MNMKNMKKQRDKTPEEELPRSEGVQYATGEEQRTIINSFKKMKQLGQSKNDAQLWMCQWT